MTYVKQTWANGPNGGTPISATRLNHMEDGIENPAQSIPTGTFLTYVAESTGIAATDTTTIQAALDAVPDGGTVIVILQPRTGPYNTNADLIPKAGTIIKGPGRDIPTIKLTGTNRGFYITEKANVVIEDMMIDCNKANTADGGASAGQQAIFFEPTAAIGTPGATIRRVKAINGWYRGLDCKVATGVTSPLTAEITDCIVSGMGTNGIRVNGATHSTVSGNDVSNNGSTGLHVVGGANAIVDKNRVHDHANSHGILVNTAHVGAIVTNNICWSNLGTGNWGIVIGVGTRRFVVANNYCYANAGNMTIDTADSAQPGVLFEGGTVANNVCVAATQSQGISVNMVDGLTITGNTCAFNTQAGIRITGRNVTITANTVHSNGQDGVFFMEGTFATSGPHFYASNNVYNNNTSAAATYANFRSEVLGNGAVVIGQPKKFVRKTANESVTSSDVLQDDDHLSFAIERNQTVVFRGLIVYDGATTGDIKIGFTAPSGATMTWGAYGLSASASGATGQVAAAAAITSINYGAAGTGTKTVVMVTGLVRNSTTAGTVQLRWAQVNIDATATTVYADSFLEANVVA